MKPILCVRLLSWPIDRLKRRRSGLPREANPARGDARQASNTPLVLLAAKSENTSRAKSSSARPTSAGQNSLRPIVAYACDLARVSNVRPGMSLADAHALCPGLVDLPHDPAKDARSLEALARWLMRFTPAVAIEGADAIFLDVTGCEELFGGLDRLLQLVTTAVARMGLRANIVIAPTPGAAWALATCGSFANTQGDRLRLEKRQSSQIVILRYSEGSGPSPKSARSFGVPQDDNRRMDPKSVEPIRATESDSPNLRERIFTPEQLLPALLPLPPHALRLEPAVAESLHKVGIDSIRQLLAIPRDTLPVRFGDQLLLRLDQALGRVPELLTTLDHHTPINAHVRFDYAIDATETIWHVFKHLLAQIVPELRRRGCGARQLHLRFERDRAAPLEHTVQLSAPSRHIGNLHNLLRCALETVHTHQGFTGFFLSVPMFDKIAEEQSLLMGQDERDAQVESLRLIERLRARLGERTVESADLVESHLPERTCRFVEAVADRPDRRASRPHRVLVKSSEGLGFSAMRDNAATAVADSSSDPQNPRLPSRRRPAHKKKNDDPDAIDLHAPSADRPLHLLAAPVEIAVIVSPSEDHEGHPVSFTHRGTVHRLAYAIGPERIAGVWWDRHNKTRDYFEVEDNAGLRFWIFRVMETWRWYLHGSFA